MKAVIFRVDRADTPFSPTKIDKSGKLFAAIAFVCKHENKRSAKTKSLPSTCTHVSNDASVA